MEPKLIVHGGAWNIPDEFERDHISGVHKAVADVYPGMLDGMTALEAVEAAVNILELDPTFDAGRGSFLNARGQVEMDASIMDGANLKFGAPWSHPGFHAPCFNRQKDNGRAGFLFSGG